MADSIPSLRRKLNEAMARIRELEARPDTVEVVREVVIRTVEVPVVTTKEVYFPIPGPETIIHQDNPDHIATIRVLQEKLCQFTSQSDSLSSQDQEPPQSQSAPE